MKNKRYILKNGTKKTKKNERHIFKNGIKKIKKIGRGDECGEE